MYYEPHSGMYFSYDPLTQTHRYHGQASAAKFRLLSHIIYSRSRQQDKRAQADKSHKVLLLLTLILLLVFLFFFLVGLGTDPRPIQLLLLSS